MNILHENESRPNRCILFRLLKSDVGSLFALDFRNNSHRPVWDALLPPLLRLITLLHFNLLCSAFVFAVAACCHHRRSRDPARALISRSPYLPLTQGDKCIKHTALCTGEATNREGLKWRFMLGRVLGGAAACARIVYLCESNCLEDLMITK